MPSGAPLYLYIGELPFQTELRKGTHLLELLVQVNSLDELPWHWWSPATCISPNTSFRCLSWVPSRPHFRPGEISFSLKYFKQNVLDSTKWCFSCSSVCLKISKLPLALPQSSLNQIFHRWSLIECSSFSGWLTDVLVVCFAEVLKFIVLKCCNFSATEISCALNIWRFV